MSSRGELINSKARLGAKIVELRERIKKQSNQNLLNELAIAEIDHSLVAGELLRLEWKRDISI